MHKSTDLHVGVVLPRNSFRSDLKSASTQALRVLFCTEKKTITGLLAELRSRVTGGDGAAGEFPYFDSEWTLYRLSDVLSAAGAFIPGGFVDQQALRDAVLDELLTDRRKKKTEAEKFSREVERLYASGLKPLEIQERTGIPISRIRVWVGHMRRGTMYIR